MSLDRFVGTESTLAPPGWKKPQHVLDAIKKRRAAKMTKRESPAEKAWCPTGPGGGKDNSCPPNKGKASQAVVDWAAKNFDDPAHAKAFVEWFGDSAVVDDEGAPKVQFHHGSFDETADSITIGENGMHFGTKDAATQRAYGKLDDDLMTNLEVYQNEDGTWGWESGSEESFETFGDEDAARSDAENTFAGMEHGYDMDATDLGTFTEVYLAIKNPMVVADQKADWSAAVKEAKAKGHDGIVYRNEFEDAGSLSYIAFSADQIKSVNNAGTFDPENPDITKSAKAFCPNGPGNGITNDCPPKRSSGGGVSPAFTATAFAKHQKKLASLRKRIASTVQKAYTKWQESLQKYNESGQRLNAHQDVIIELSEQNKTAIAALADPMAGEKERIAAEESGRRLMEARLALEPMAKEHEAIRQAAIKAHDASGVHKVVARLLAKEAAAVDKEDGIPATMRKSLTASVKDAHKTDYPIQKWAKEMADPAESLRVASRSEVAATRQDAQEFLRSAVNPTLHATALLAPLEYAEFVRANAAGFVSAPEPDAPPETATMEVVGRIQLASFDSAEVVVHEYGHQIEHGNVEAAKICDAFLQHRIANETPIKLADKFPEHGYKDDEMGTPDDFGKAFRSVYQSTDEAFIDGKAHYAGKVYPEQGKLSTRGDVRFLGSTEVLSMGMQLLKRDPVGFAQADPEWFDLVVGITTGRVLDQTRATRSGYASK
jgi:hypothetical protein